MTEGEENKLAILGGMSKKLLSEIPLLGILIAGYDEYQRFNFERAVREVMNYLKTKVDNLQKLFTSDWFKSEHGQLYSRKVLDAAIDCQMEDKRELFVNALINGIAEKDIGLHEKLKFVDMLRQLSRSALEVLAEMHQLYKDRIKLPGTYGNGAPATINRDEIVKFLGSRIHPYVIDSALHELGATGLFSTVSEWHRNSEGKYIMGLYHERAECYTEFTLQFVQFISQISEKTR